MDGRQGDYVGQLTTAILYINQRYNQHTDNKWGYVGQLTTVILDINYQYCLHTDGWQGDYVGQLKKLKENRR